MNLITTLIQKFNKMTKAITQKWVMAICFMLSKVVMSRMVLKPYITFSIFAFSWYSNLTKGSVNKEILFL